MGNPCIYIVNKVLKKDAYKQVSRLRKPGLHPPTLKKCLYQAAEKEKENPTSTSNIRCIKKLSGKKLPCFLCLTSCYVPYSSLPSTPYLPSTPTALSISVQLHPAPSPPSFPVIELYRRLCHCNSGAAVH